jgi:phosphoribosylformylglycinamidine synthase
MSKIVHYYRKTEPPHSLLPSVKAELKDLGFAKDASKIASVETESCFNVLVSSELSAEQTSRLEWLLAETFDRGSLKLEESSLDANGSATWKIEFGPRMTFTSAFSSNAVSICQACDVPIQRLELSRRYLFQLTESLDDKIITLLKGMLHDRMTEEEYSVPLTTFDSGAETVATKNIPIMEKGRAALEEINKEMGLGFDDFDLDYYTNLFKVRWTMSNH